LHDICADLHDHFETQARKPAGEFDADDHAQLNRGIADILNAVNTVGTQSGLDAFQPTSLRPPLTDAPRIPEGSHPEVYNTVKATGTGRTTGHIADLTVSNPTDQPVQVHIGNQNAFIPSAGGYQPYIVPYIPVISLQPGETKSIPIIGYCTDIRMPPVPSGVGMPAPGSWFTVPSSTSTPSSPGDVVVPTYLTLSIPDATELVGSLNSVATTPSSQNADCMDVFIPPGPLIPGTNQPFPSVFGGQSIPEVSAPIMFDALNRITHQYDTLKAQGTITTPFSGNPEKEREAVIQQTFWIYSALIGGEKKYTKEDFTENTVRQFEQNTGMNFDSITTQQQDRVNAGVDDFWNTFEAVGVAAKILSTPPSTPVNVPAMSDFWDQDARPVKSQPQQPITTTTDHTTAPGGNARPVLPPLPGTMTVDNDQCECANSTIAYQVHYTPRFREKKIYGAYMSKVRDTIKVESDNGSYKNVAVLPDDEIQVRVPETFPGCSACYEGDCVAVDTAVYIKAVGLDDYAEYKQINKDADGAYTSATASVTALKEDQVTSRNPVRIYVKLSYHCHGEAVELNCNRKHCESVFELTLPRYIKVKDAAAPATPPAQAIPEDIKRKIEEEMGGNVEEEIARKEHMRKIQERFVGKSKD
jgi:hypothetical protein